MPQSDGTTRERILTLERQAAALSARLDLALAQQGGGTAKVRTRLARTTTSTSYPGQPANSFEIEFLDGTFTETPGQQTPTYTARSANPTAVCHHIAGNLPPENTVIEVFQHNGKWWTQYAVGENDDTQLVKVDTDVTDCTDAGYDEGGCIWSGQLVQSSINPAGGTACNFPHNEVTAIWITTVNQCPAVTVLQEGEIYLAKKVGTWDPVTPSADPRDLYALQAPEDAGDSVQIVKVAPSGTECEDVSDDSNCVWPGKVIALNAIATASKCDFPHSDVEDCFIVALNNCNQVTTLKRQERYLGKLVGTHDDGTNEWPLYAVFVGLEGKQEAYRFTVNSGQDFADGEADCTVVNPDGTAGPGVVTVEDPLGLFARSFGPNAGGWCVKYHDGMDDRYFAIQAEQYPFYGTALLTSAISGTGTKAINTFEGISPPPFHDDSETVTQAENVFALEGGAGDLVFVAYRNSLEDWIIVAVANQGKQVFKCRLSTSMSSQQATAIIYEPDGVTVKDAAATVHDPHDKFPRAFGDTTGAGSHGDVVLFQGEYYAIHLQQLTPRLQGILGGTLTGDKTETVTVNSILPLEQSEWSQWTGATTITNVKNYYGHFGESGDRCELFWTNQTNEYRIDIVEQSGAVRVSSGDDLDYLENQFRPIATRDPLHDFVIHYNFQPDTQFGAADDPLVTSFVDSSALPGYDGAPSEFLALGLQATNGQPGFQELTSFINTDERVKVNAGDLHPAEYLDAQLKPTASYVSSEDLQLRFDTDTIGAAGSAAIMCFLDSTLAPAVAFDQNTQFLGFLPGTGWRKMAVPPDFDEKVKVSITDTADYLNQQLMPTASYATSEDLQFRFATDTIGGGGSQAIMCFLDATTTPLVSFDEDTEFLGRLPGTGWRRMVVPSFTDFDEKVKVNSGDTAAFLDQQLMPTASYFPSEDLQFRFATDTIGGGGSPAIMCFLDASTAPLVSFDSNTEFLGRLPGTGWRRMVAPSFVNTDEHVKVNASDTTPAEYLDAQLQPTATYNTSEDLQFRFATDTIGAGGSPAIMSFLDATTTPVVSFSATTEFLGRLPGTGWRRMVLPAASDLDEKVKVNAADTAAYLDQQLFPQATYTPAEDIILAYWINNDSTLGAGGGDHVTAIFDGSRVPTSSYLATSEFLGRVPGTGWRRMVLPAFTDLDEKVKTHSGDPSAGFLDTKQANHKVTTLDPLIDLQISTRTVGNDIDYYIRRGDILTASYTDEAALMHVPGVGWRMIVPPAGGGGPDLDEKVKVNGSDAAAFLDQQLMPTAAYNVSEDLQMRFATDSIGGGGSPAIMSFLDATTTPTVPSASGNEQYLALIPGTGWRRLSRQVHPVFACKLTDNMGSISGGPSGGPWNGANATLFSLAGTNLGTIQVWDRWGTGGLNSDAVQNSEGYCVYDGTFYYAVHLEKEIAAYRVQLSANMSRDTTTASINWASRVRVSPRPYVRDRSGTPTTALNIHRLAGLSGGWVTILRNDSASPGTTNRWLVIAAEAYHKQSVRCLVGSGGIAAGGTNVTSSVVAPSFGDGLTSSGTITLHSYFIDAPAGAKGLAVWRDGINYELIQVEC